MQPPSSAQLILGADKRNPVINIYENPDQTQFHVYYGFELMEVVPDLPTNHAFKLMVARLYNAGVKARSLSEAFEVDRKTMQRWGRALNSGDAQELVRVLEGRWSRRKLTPEIQAYVRMRWPDVIAQSRVGCSQRLCREIRAVFKVQLSTETLRPLVRELKAAVKAAAPPPPPPAAAPCAPPTPEAPATPTELATQDPQPPQSAEAAWPDLADPSGAAAAQTPVEKRETPWACVSTAPSGEDPGHGVVAEPVGPCDPAPWVEPPKPKVSAVLPTYPPAQTLWCDHAGLLLFWRALIRVRRALDPVQPLLPQWLATLLLGAVNLEQTKFLNWQDLEILLGAVVRFPAPQREQLKQLATEATIQALLRSNVEQLTQAVGRDFYCDPHTKHYTGEQNVLKGWCPKIRWADKALHSDFIHTARGEPIYFETTDNFEDLRARFFAVIQRCRGALGLAPEEVLSMVVDRGIFGHEVFEKVLADPFLHLITWQKGYVAGAWAAEKVGGRLVIERTRNHAGDVRSYHFEYIDQDWAQDPRLRQLEVRATNPDGRTAQVAILTDDRQRPGEQIVRLIFNRWLQENDFKYLDKHYGINQITSYRSIPYAELRGKVQDREVQSGQVKALRQQRRQWHAQQSRLLLVQERCDHKARQREALLTQWELRAAQGPAPQAAAAPIDAVAQMARLRAAQQRHEATRAPRAKAIEEWSRKLLELEGQFEAAAKKVSRLDEMIAANMVRMEPQSKRLLDTLRIMARNVFYEALAPFKKDYDNYRDDHDYFRQLTQAPGVLEVGAEVITVHLMPKTNYSPQLRRIVEKLLGQLNEQGPELPDGTKRRVRFRLARKSELRLSMAVEGA